MNAGSTRERLKNEMYNAKSIMMKNVMNEKYIETI